MKEKNQIYKCPVCGYLLSEISSEIPDHCPGCLSGIHEPTQKVKYAEGCWSL